LPRSDEGGEDASYVAPAQGFAELAATYDARLSGNPVPLVETTATLTALPDVTGRQVLDIGCGTGRYALQLARMGAAFVTGADLCVEMLQQARRKADRGELSDLCQWVQGDLLDSLPLPEDTYHTIVCAMTLSFLAHPAPAFRTFARLLAPGGTLVLSDLHPMRVYTQRFLRFAAVNGAEWRIRRYPHPLSIYITAAQENSLTFEHLAEPVVDRRLANQHPDLWDIVEQPLAYTMRFRKGVNSR
jgi:malonyl-CoA O-methyltransferase